MQVIPSAPITMLTRAERPVTTVHPLLLPCPAKNDDCARQCWPARQLPACHSRRLPHAAPRSCSWRASSLPAIPGACLTQPHARVPGAPAPCLPFQAPASRSPTLVFLARQLPACHSRRLPHARSPTLVFLARPSCRPQLWGRVHRGARAKLQLGAAEERLRVPGGAWGPACGRAGMRGAAKRGACARIDPQQADTRMHHGWGQAANSSGQGSGLLPHACLAACPGSAVGDWRQAANR